MRHLAIIGGGFAGAMAAVHAIHAAREQCVLHWYDPISPFGRGLAYGACEDFHLLNVRAGKMGATPNDIGGFYQWLTRHETTPYTAQDFVPRRLFGDYVQHLLDVAAAQDSKVALRRHASAVTHVEVVDGALVLHPDHLPEAVVHKLVLATGNESPAIPGFIGKEAQAHPAFVADPWHPAAASVLASAPQSFRGHACIIGTGLTAVDVALALLRRHPGCRITLVSRHGLLPAEHAKEGLHPPALPQPLPGRLVDLWALVKSHMRNHEVQGGNWRDVIDSLRPHTPHLWHALSEADKRRAQRHGMARWQVARHRMASSVASELHDHLLRRHINLIAGQVQPVTMVGDKFSIAVKKHGMEFGLTADALLLCTGPNTALSKSHTPLLRQMHEAGLLQAGPLGQGAALAEDGTAKGTAAGQIMPMGNLIAGEWLECTAVPELRAQAQRAGGWLAG